MYAKNFFSKSSLIVATSLILAACGAPAAPAAPTAAPAEQKPAEPAKPTEAPKQAEAPKPTEAPKAPDTSKTLRILYWQAPTILNFHQGQGTKDADSARLVLEPLGAFTPQAKLVPILAAEIPTVENGGVSKDFKTVTWKIKSGVKWSDGSPLTADDVVFTAEYCLDKATACSTGSNFGNIEKVEKVDDTTIKLTYKASNPNVYEAFTGSAGYILQKKQFGDCKGENANKSDPCKAANLKPIGTGPFKVREFKPGDVVTYDANENYRDYPAKPFFKEVIFKGGGDAPSAARAAFQTGDTDYAWNLQVEAAVLLQLVNAADAKAILATNGANNSERIVINFSNPDPKLGDKRAEPDQKHPALSDLNVRKALSMAIDRKTMAEQLYGPAGDPTCELLTYEPFIKPEQIFGGRNKCTADIEGANKLLDDAGWKKGADGIREKGGVKLKFTYNTSTNTLRQKEQALVKEAWGKIGVDVELKNVSATVFFSTDQGSPDTFGKFWNDVQMYTNGSGSPDPTTYLCDFSSSEVANKANGWKGSNNGRYQNKDYDALCDQLRSETDSAKRVDIALKMNDILVQDVAVIPLVFRKSVSGISKDLKGISMNGGFDSEMWNIADWTK
jgi:peptide/nickel transport system substrate-binding protein